jgi:SAM-dependent methyltransferase
MKEKKTETVVCIVCGSDDHELISNQGQFDIPVHVVVCRNCGLSFLNPRWTKAEYMDFYAYEYDKYYRPEITKKPKPAVVHAADNPIIIRFKKLNVPSMGIQSVLDIGSGEGRNLEDLSKLFPDAEYYAIEPSQESQKILKQNGYHVLSDDVDANWNVAYSGKFDLIIMRHVLEHFLDPAAVLEKVKDVLKDDGMLYLAVPDSLKAGKALQNFGFRVVHTYYFNKYSLSNLMKKTKFEILSIVEGDTYNKNEIFLFAKKSKNTRDNFAPENCFEVQKNFFAEQIIRENKCFYHINQFLKRQIRKLPFKN